MICCYSDSRQRPVSVPYNSLCHQKNHYLTFMSSLQFLSSWHNPWRHLAAVRFRGRARFVVCASARHCLDGNRSTRVLTDKRLIHGECDDQAASSDSLRNRSARRDNLARLGARQGVHETANSEKRENSDSETSIQVRKSIPIKRSNTLVSQTTRIALFHHGLSATDRSQRRNEFHFARRFSPSRKGTENLTSQVTMPRLEYLIIYRKRMRTRSNLKRWTENLTFRFEPFFPKQIFPFPTRSSSECARQVIGRKSAFKF